MENINQNCNQNPPKKDFSKRTEVDSFYSVHPFNPKWITVGADNDLVTFVEAAGQYMAPLSKFDKQKLSASQIRNVYGEMKRIQLKIKKDEDWKNSEPYQLFMLLKPKVAYAEGRNRTMGLTLFKKIFDSAWENVENVSSYNNFCNMIEAILAYHKAYGGKDN